MSQPKRSAEEILEFVSRKLQVMSEIYEQTEYDWGLEASLMTVENFILGGDEK